MRPKEASLIQGTDVFYVPEIDSFSFSEDVVDWRPGERIAFRPFRWPLRWALVPAGIGALVGGWVSRAAGGGTWLAFSVGAGVIGWLILHWIRSPRTLAFDWTEQVLSIRSSFGVHKIPFADLLSVRIRPIEDPPLNKLDPMEYQAVLELETADAPVELLHMNCGKKTAQEACQALLPAARWMAVSLDLEYRQSETPTTDLAATETSCGARESSQPDQPEETDTPAAVSGLAHSDKATPTNAGPLAVGPIAELAEEQIVAQPWGVVEWRLGNLVRFHHASRLWNSLGSAVVFGILGWIAGVFGAHLLNAYVPAAPGTIVDWLPAGLAIVAGALRLWHAYLPRRDYIFDWSRREFVRHEGSRITSVPFGQLAELRLHGEHTPEITVRGKNQTKTYPANWRAFLDLVTDEAATIRLAEGTQFDLDQTAQATADQSYEELLPIVVPLAEKLNIPWKWHGFEMHESFEPTRTKKPDVPPSPQQLAAKHFMDEGRLALVRAKHAYETGSEDASQHVGEAIAKFSQATRVDPDQVEGFMEIGKICEDTDDHDSAIRVYTVALEAHPDLVRAYCRRGFLLELADDYDAAIADYTEAIRVEPSEPDHYRQRGNAQADCERYSGAIEDFTRYLELTDDPEYTRFDDSYRQSQQASVLAARANAHKAKGEKQLALADIQRARKLDPDNVYVQGIEAAMRDDPQAGF